MQSPPDLLCACALQLLREAASRGGHMAHAAGTSPPPPTAPLGASGAETMKEFEVKLLPPARLHSAVHHIIGMGKSSRGCWWAMQ